MRITDFFRYSLALMAMFAVCGADAEQMPNPRSASSVVINSGASGTSRADASRVVRVAPDGANGSDTTTPTGRDGASVSRSATSRPSATVSRSATAQQSGKNIVSGRSATVRNVRGTTGGGVVSSNGTARSATARSATNVVRNTTHNPAGTARAGAVGAVANVSRAGQARATAVFTDIDAIGGGYAQCREAYATCMDQFCANASDTYRRCFCSARYTEFRDMENAMSQAVDLLAQFENNNLTAVGLTAEEVAAMYSATEGENAIKDDTSGAASLLSEIDDLLSGNSSTSASSSNSNTGVSLGILSVDFTSDLGDLWGGGGTTLFDVSTGVDMTTLEGQDLFDAANRQCLSIVADQCENNAVLTMARSAYGIMITQDCNTYERHVNSQKEALEQTVRTAEKYLREARLEEYQSHNSDDVNSCIANVRSAILSDVACGPNYERCLDYTGAYINQTTGEAIYSPRLFQLADLIQLPGVTSRGADDDILGANAEFNAFLDSRRIYAETALDTCRDLADIVWEEFKRQALIEIAQAQDEQLEEVRMSCVSTMAECYNTQTGALQSFDDTTAQYTGAISAYAARQMCEDQVIACASLYGDTDGCEFDGNGRLTVGNASGGLTGAAANERCGLTALLAFVDTVDTVRVAEGCETAIDNYLVDLCTPESGGMAYPWNCRNMDPTDLRESVTAFAERNCADPTADGAELLASVNEQVERAISDVMEGMDYMLGEQCEGIDGYWVSADEIAGENEYGTIYDDRIDVANTPLLSGFYGSVYGGTENTGWGRCVENTTRIRCLDYNLGLTTPVATYDLVRDECTFTEEWYRQQCEELMGGYFEGQVCYVKQ